MRPALVITAAVLAFLEFVVEPRFFRRDKFSGLLIVLVVSVSYTHLTLPTNREV